MTGSLTWPSQDGHAACRHGIEASCTLHWFVHPRWFDLIGGFTKADNIDVYVDWACTAFRLFGEKIISARQSCCSLEHLCRPYEEPELSVSGILRSMAVMHGAATSSAACSLC